MERVPHRYLVQECDWPAVQVHRAWVGRRVVVNSRRVIIVASVGVGGGVSSGVVRTRQRRRGTLLMVSKHVGVVPDVGWVVKCGQTASWAQPMRGCTGPAPTRSRSLSGALDCPKGVFLILDRPMSPDVPSNPPWTRAAPISARTGSNEDNGVVFLASSMSTRLCTMTCRKEVGRHRKASERLRHARRASCAPVGSA